MTPDEFSGDYCSCFFSEDEDNRGQVQFFSERDRAMQTASGPGTSVLGRLVGFCRVLQRISPSTSRADGGPFLLLLVGIVGATSWAHLYWTIGGAH